MFRFSEPFQIGRDRDCGVRVDDVQVSRKHVAASFDRGVWWLRDLKSANGTYVGGRRIEAAPVEESLSISLGMDGPVLAFEVQLPGGTGRPSPLPQTIKKRGGDAESPASDLYDYFRSREDSARVGPRTKMLHRAVARIQREQRNRYWWIIGVLTLAVLGMAGIAVYKHWQIRQQQAVALKWFYTMKALDVDIANVERLVAASGNALAKNQTTRYVAQRRELEGLYDEYVSALKLYDASLSEEDRLILRVTRLFGECELAAPQEYMMNVKRYIKKWQSTTRYRDAIEQATQMGFVRTIVDEFEAQNLPPQFFYLALQESGFDPFASGPPTYAGIAKGMWQFIPETGSRYGLTIGPLATARRPDPGDDRHHWQKATRAAAKYIKDIYATDAQASGLLVMASYNWGEGRVIKLLRSMPPNPRERNFWKVLEKHHDRVPNETYDYVFYIVSAAVIGENPGLFGFSFENPLQTRDDR